MKRLWRKLAIIALLAVAFPVLTLAQSTINDCAPDTVVSQDQINFVVSLAAIERSLKRCASVAQCGQDARRLYGLKRLDGFMVDPSGDIILLGRKSAGLSPLDIDDLIVMLRHALHMYAPQTQSVDATGRVVITRTITSAGVTIDPIPEAIAAISKLAQTSQLEDYTTHWPRICSTPMYAKTLGIPHGTSPSAKMMQADVMLKYLSNGQMKIPGVPSVLQRNLSSFLEQGSLGSGSLTRYWFTAGVHEVLEDDGLFLFRRANVALLDEAEHLDASGQISANGQINSVARSFSCDMTKNFSRLIERPDLSILKELDDVFRWGLLAKFLTSENAFKTARYTPNWLINSHAEALYDVPDQFSGVSRIFRWPEDASITDRNQGPKNLRVVFASCGGVSVDFSGLKMLRQAGTSAGLSNMAQSVFRQKPSPRAHSWPVRIRP